MLSRAHASLQIAVQCLRSVGVSSLRRVRAPALKEARYGAHSTRIAMLLLPGTRSARSMHEAKASYRGDEL